MGAVQHPRRENPFLIFGEVLSTVSPTDRRYTRPGLTTDRIDMRQVILRELPRFPLADIPTPLQRLERLSAYLGGPGILMKRDDMTGLAFGGNKTRKL